MPFVLFALMCMLAVTPGVATAQTLSSPGSTAADSASAARAAWGTALRAWRSGDTAATRREVARAAAWWPTQPIYVWNRAVMAAAQRDTVALQGALADYAKLGLGRDLSTEERLAAFSQASWFARFRAMHDAHRSVIARSHVRAVLNDSTLWPEGVDFDPRSGRFYVASIRHRTIVEVARDGATRELWPRAQKNVGAMMGVRVDTTRNVLWATMAGLPQMSDFVPADSTIAALVMIRIADGAILKRWDLTTSTPHVLGDLAVAPGGSVFVTDSRDPALYRLRSEHDTLEALRHPLFRSLQGIAVAPSGRVVYVADYSHGLLRIDLATHHVSRVADAPHSTTLGCDGIVWYENAIIAVQNGVAPARVMRFGLDPSGGRIVRADVLDRNFPIADEPTIGTLAGDEYVYVANSQWNKYSEHGTLNRDARLSRPILLGLPLKASSESGHDR